MTALPNVRSKFNSVTSATKEYCLATAHQRDLFTGLIRIHALVHAYHEPIFGQAMMEELKRHGYRIGPGTMYPLLHGMERGGLLKSELKNVNGRRRRVYRTTAFGTRALDKAREKVDELHHELHEERPRMHSLTSS
jgi:PadR family transcriptional regulator PadR